MSLSRCLKAMVLFSGGIDSTTCLGMAIEKYGAQNVIALSISYGQKHTKEIEASDKIAKYYNVKHIYLDLEKIFQYSDCSLLSHSDKEIPKEAYSEQIRNTNGSPVSTYVPFRNGLFLSSAASIALSLGCSEIYYGAHADDAAGSAYPDCSSAFNNAINEAIYLGSGKQIKIVAPFIASTKDQVVKKGLKLNVPYKYTWSCYEGGEKPCGKCGTCIDRARAFELNGIKDCEELHLSNGETIAINFVFIVSILELANNYRKVESEDDEYGMENAILGLPLVLDGPFSALSAENTSLISNRLPQFAEQVIIFMLDKDWEASGLDKSTLPEYRYRVYKQETSNSSTIEHE